MPFASNSFKRIPCTELLNRLLFFFTSPGSPPAASTFFAWFLISRASASVTVGKTPKANLFYLPPKRYFILQ